VAKNIEDDDENENEPSTPSTLHRVRKEGFKKPALRSLGEGGCQMSLLNMARSYGHMDRSMTNCANDRSLPTEPINPSIWSINGGRGANRRFSCVSYKIKITEQAEARFLFRTVPCALHTRELAQPGRT
jgi:hypothetical protein